MAVTSRLLKFSLDTSQILVTYKWRQNVTVHVSSKTVGTRNNYEHGILIRLDDKAKGHRMFIKRNKKILVSQYVRSIDAAKKSIEKDLCTGDDVLTHDTSDAEFTSSHSDFNLSDPNRDTIDVEFSVGENPSLAERRKCHLVTMRARYAGEAAMAIIPVKEPRSVEEAMALLERQTGLVI